MSVISNVLPDIKILQSLEETIHNEKEKRSIESEANKELMEKIKILHILLCFSRSSTI